LKTTSCLLISLHGVFWFWLLFGFMWH